MEIARRDGEPRLRITVLDRLGVIAAASEGGSAAAPIVSSRGASVGVTGPRTLALEFLASPCTKASTVDVRESAQRIEFAVDVPKLLDCDALAETLSVELQLLKDASAEHLSVTSNDGDARSWGVVVPASDGPILPITVVDRSRRVREVFAIASWDGAPASGIAAMTSVVNGSTDVELVWSRQTCDDSSEITVDHEPGAMTVQVELANTSGISCSGPRSSHGIRLRVAGTIQAEDLSTRLVVRR